MSSDETHQLDLWPPRPAPTAPTAPPILEEDLRDVIAPTLAGREATRWARVAYEHQMGFNVPLPDAPFPGGPAHAIRAQLNGDTTSAILSGLAAVRARDDSALDAWLARGSMIWRGQYEHSDAVFNEIEPGPDLDGPAGSYAALALMARLGRLDILDALHIPQPLAQGPEDPPFACAPPEIAMLQHLEHLHFGHTCGVLSLPPAVGRLPALTHLSFRDTDRVLLPPSLLGAPRLRVIRFERAAPAPDSEVIVATLLAKGMNILNT